MKQINESELSQFLQDLLSEASAAFGKVQLRINDNPLFDVAVQTVVENNGDYILYIKPEAVDDEYTISHEILHLCVRKLVPNFVRVIEPNLIGMIGTELQGYLEHNWILAEQKRRGLEIDEFKLYADIEEKIGMEEDRLEKNINRILTLNNILHTHPAVYAEHEEFFAKNAPKSLAISKRIMSHYPKQELYSNYEARRCTVHAIKEWNNVFGENGLKSVNFGILLSVTPVFSAGQLKRMANVVLGLLPNAIVNNKSQSASNILYTMNDGQCCAIFSMDENSVKGLVSLMNKMTLEEFLGVAKIPFLLR